MPKPLRNPIARALPGDPPSSTRWFLGTWKSDRRQTLAHCQRYHALRDTAKRRFADLFGRLELRYTSRKIRFTLGDSRWTARYELVAADGTSVVLRVQDDDLWKKADPLVADLLREMSAPRLQHLHFAAHRGREYYWIGCGRFCEWFRRVPEEPTSHE